MSDHSQIQLRDITSGLWVMPGEHGRIKFTSDRDLARPIPQAEAELYTKDRAWLQAVPASESSIEFWR